MIRKPDSEDNYYQIGKDLATELASITIEECNFSVRTSNALRRYGTKNCLEVSLMSEKDFYKIKNCGKKSIEEIKSFFRTKGINRLPVIVSDLESNDIGKITPNLDDKFQKMASALEKLRNIRITDTNLSVRSINCCLANNIMTLYDFTKLSEEDALKIPNLGRRSFIEIKDLINSYGVTYPFGNIDFSNLRPSVKYMGVSNETTELLYNKKIIFVDDLKQLDSLELNSVLSKLSIHDRNIIIYHLADNSNIKISDEYFDDYLKFVIEKLLDNLNEADSQLLSLAFGLFNNKIWPLDVLASTLSISEQQMTETIDEIVSLLIEGSNYSKLLIVMEYYKTKDSDFYLRNGYTLLLKYIVELVNKKMNYSN